MSSCISSLDLGSPLHSISASFLSNLAIVGGRDVVKVVGLGADGAAAELKTLKISAKADIKFSITDVAWSRLQATPGLCAAALNNGGLAVWDVAHNVTTSWSGINASFPLSLNDRSEKLLTEHKRAVNCICWHPTNPHILLSCSMDHTAKLWDRRVTGRYCQATYKPKCDAIREVQCNPLNGDRIAMVLDNGQLQIWDRRKASQPHLKVQAHLQSSMALDWHPTREHFIATASRDRTVRVWDLSLAMDAQECTNGSRIQPLGATPESTAHLPSPVSRVTWRPGMPSQFAVCCGSGACSGDIFVNDVTEPYVPWRVLEGEDDICMDFEWCDSGAILPCLEKAMERMERMKDEAPTQNSSVDSSVCSYVVACGKDGWVRYHSVRKAMNPRGDISPCVLALGARSNMAYVYDPVFEPLAPHCPSLLKPAQQPSALGTLDSNFLGTKFESARSPSPAEDSLLRQPSFLKLKAYSQGALGLQHNARALPGAKLELAKSQSDDLFSPAFGVEDGDSDEDKVDESQENFAICNFSNAGRIFPPFRRPRAIIKMWETPAVSEMLGYDPQVVHFLATRYALRGLTAREACAANAKVASSYGLAGLGHIWRVLHAIFSGSGMESPSNFQAPIDQQNGDIGGGNARTEEEERAAEAKEGKDEDREQQLFPGGQDSATAAAGGGAAAAAAAATVAVRDSSTGAPAVAADSSDKKDEFTMPEALALLEEQGQQGADKFLKTNSREGKPLLRGGVDGSGGYSLGPLQWMWRSVVSDLLSKCVESGDSQHCVVLCELARLWEAESRFCESWQQHEAMDLGGWHGLGKEPWQVREWYMSYIEQLHKLQLWDVATALIKYSDDAVLAEENRKGTSVHTACSSCNTLSAPHCRCPKCSSVVSECSLCMQPVRGLFVWCPGCSHGGHLTHMQEWFAATNVCPTGCGHKCNFSSFGSSTNE